MSFSHQPVLLSETIAHLGIVAGGVYVDGTLGGGGHSEAILKAGGRVFGVDRDPSALTAAQARLSGHAGLLGTAHGAFADLERLAGHLAPVDGVLLDLGVSSPQLDTGARGFSLQQDGPVDMRMDPTQPLDARGLLEQLDEAGLTRILREYGEEPRARPIARAILAGRPWNSTLALASCVAQASGYRGGRTHPATRAFQALRIAVNGELEQLVAGMEAALHLLRPGGRLAIITFHSLEDRLVKQRFQRAAGRDAPRDGYGDPLHPPEGRLLSPRGVAGADADPTNPRARSARLRVLEKLSPPLPLATAVSPASRRVE